MQTLPGLTPQHCTAGHLEWFIWELCRRVPGQPQESRVLPAASRPSHPKPPRYGISAAHPFCGGPHLSPLPTVFVCLFVLCVCVYPRMDCARKTFSWLQLICRCGFKLQMALRYPRNLLLASEHEPLASGYGGYHAGEENGCSWGRSTCSQYKGCFTAQSCCGSGECGRAEQSRADKKASVLLGCASPMAFTALFTSGKQLRVRLSSV